MGSTNKTAHYELSQYVGSDKPTYLVDYNQDMSTIDSSIYAAKEEADVNKAAIGTLSNLTTTVKTDLVNAVNEVNSYTSSIGTLTDLTTTAKTSCVAAINEVNGKASDIGDLTDLTTTAKTSAVAAINEVDANVGVLANLTTTSKSSAVAAINELDSDLGSQATEIGDLTNLSTTVKTDLVSAINEVDTLIEELDNYSTSETDTGKHWIDGKRIYRKVLEFSRTDHNQFTLSLGVSPSPDKIISVTGFAFSSNNQVFPVYRVNDTDQFRFYMSDHDTINVNVGSSYPSTPFTGFMVVEYTKQSQ